MEHGKRSTFVNHGCRCLHCRVANALYQTPRKAMVKSGEWQGRRPSADAQRMIRRLRLEGFTLVEIGKRMGLTTPLRMKKTMQARSWRRLEEFYNYYIEEGKAA